MISEKIASIHHNVEKAVDYFSSKIFLVQTHYSNKFKINSVADRKIIFFSGILVIFFHQIRFLWYA